MRIRSATECDWVAELRSVKGIESVQSLESSGRPDMYRYRWSPPPSLPKLFEKYDLIGVVPILCSNGYGTFSIALSKNRLGGSFGRPRPGAFRWRFSNCVRSAVRRKQLPLSIFR